MSNQHIQVVGASCGQHGSYVFYKAFSFACAGRRRVLALGEFFFVKLWTGQDQVCLGELQLIFEEGGSGERLACLRLYFLPEHTPDGRLECHGQDEVLAVQEKLTVRLEDLADVVVRVPRWAAGWPAGGGHNPAGPAAAFCSTAAASGRLAMADVERAKRSLGDTVDPDEPCALVLSYDRYCRLRGLMKRLESVNPRVYTHALVRALGGQQIPSRNTRLLYCRDVFDYPELDSHEVFCNHLAPKLRGRSRKKARRDGSSPSSESTSDTESSLPKMPTAAAHVTLEAGSLRRKPTLMRGLMPSGKQPHQLKSWRWGEKELLQRLHHFMNQRGTPIKSMPIWGLQNLSLFRLYRRVQQLGGYQSVCARRLWKQVFDEMGGSPHNTAAGTCTRRCYERLCLPFERYDRGLPEPMAEQRPRLSAGPAPRPPGQPPAAGTSVLSALAQTRPSITITPLPRPTRIGSITITPVGKAPSPAAAPLGSVEQLMALHMASTSLPPQMLQYMAGFPAVGKASGLEQLHRAQQQMALQSLMAQRMTMMPSMPGMTKEQAQANIEAYQRMLQGNFNKS
ncbi:AT-rich interactive domain-containing protein 5B-like [Pollicipes pollicipes]|uniref:AT-rich interactive domain-containing protein 5B-like n=1 Tax=Pollicipes pollicipes TaxID=41117 RepID=UPI00188535EC|nr:AT-rich interactive domain-containing protein 5B-like [Pollicipes pollicipes]